MTMAHYHDNPQQFEPHELEPDAIRRDSAIAIAEAAGGNFGLGALSIAAIANGGGSPTVIEMVHDMSDGVTHGVEAYGAHSDDETVQETTRGAVVGTIVLASAVVGYKAGVDLTDPGHEPSGTATAIQAVVATGNVVIHKRLHTARHKIADRIAASKAAGHDTSKIERQLNLDGAHVHTKVDSVMAPGLFGAMVVSWATKSPQVADGATVFAAAYTAVANAVPYARTRGWLPTRRAR